MGSDTTTIEITDAQRQRLDDLKLTASESNKDVLQRLIESYSQEPDLTESRVREIAREEITDRVTFKALEQ